MKDYGTAWRILRPTSLTDQIYIKAQRIRSIEEKGMSKIEDDIRSEFIGIVNYSIMGIIQLELGTSEEPLPADKALELYSKYFMEAKILMEKKNHDYDEAWRSRWPIPLRSRVWLLSFRPEFAASWHRRA